MSKYDEIVRMSEDLEQEVMVDLLKELTNDMDAEDLMSVAAYCMQSVPSSMMDECLQQFVGELSPAIKRHLKSAL